MTKKDGESFPKDDRAAVPNPSQESIYQGRLQGFEVAGFETRGHLAVVVSNLRQAENLAFALSIAPPVRNFLAELEATAQL